MRKFVILPALVALALVVVTAAGEEDGAWQFGVAPNVWVPALSGDVAIGDVRGDIDRSAMDNLEDLKMAGMLNLEVRKNRWGLIGDGVYFKIGEDSGTPGPFFNTIDTTIALAALDLALAYRLVAGERGWLDLLLGARYVDVTASLDMDPDTEAVDAISSAVMDKTVESVQGKVEDHVKRDADDIAADLAGLKEDVGDAARDLVRENVAGEVGETVENILERIAVVDPRGEGQDLSLGDGRRTIGDGIRDDISDSIPARVDAVGDAIRDAIADAVKRRIDDRIDEIQGDAEAIAAEIRKAAEESIDELRSNASKDVQKALDEAESQLAATIEDGMTKAADADVEEEREWVDPYVGMRGRLNLTQRVFLGGRGDIGGFGVGSELTWQVFAGVGMMLTPNVEIEAGWRHLVIDYEDEPFEMDLELSGAVVGMRFGF